MLNKLCCLRLNTAAMVLGWLGCVGSVVSLAVASVGLAKTDELAKWIWTQMKENPNVSEDVIRTWITVVCVVYLVGSAINLVTSSLLILGTVKERHLLLLPWLINTGLSLFFTIVYYVAVIVMQISSDVPFGSVIFSVILSGLFIAFNYYIWYAMYSHYKQLQAAREQQQLLPRTTATSYPSYTKI